jgi:hypothetical protein
MIEKRIKKIYQKHLAKMSYSFMVQALDKSNEDVLKLYESFCKDWDKTVRKTNKKYGAFVLAHDSWKNIYERDGYRNIIFMPMEKSEKASILRIIYLVEGKTEKQRERRELLYKVMFLIFKLKHRIKQWMV